MDLSARPPLDVPIPSAVRRVAAGEPIRPVWRNELGGLTVAIGTQRYVKWLPLGAPDLADERARLAWAVDHTPVPAVLDHGADDEGQWLVTAALPGDTAVADRWLADPARAVTAIGHGLRVLHDALPVDDCPFDWSAPMRAERARRFGRTHAADWSPEHRELSPDEAFARLRATPPIDRLVVCHGDPCSPNTILDDAGTWVGHVDLGELGVADRWADLAVATWSLEWNYGPGWDAALFDAYGIAPDPERTAYYRLLWDLSP